MSKKGENIYRRKDGRWEARYMKGRGPSGKIRYGSCYGRSYKEAREKLRDIRAALGCGEPPPGERWSLEHFAQGWLAAQRGRVKNSTYEKYGGIIRRHIVPKLGSCPAGALSTRTVEEFSLRLSEEGLAPGTVRNILTVLCSVIGYGEKEQPGAFRAVEVVYPREGRRQARVLSVEEQLRLAAYLRRGADPCRYGVLIALLTGLRIGELCALRWGNISLCDRTITVDCAMQRLRNTLGGGGRTQVVIGPPKSDMSERIIPMPDAVAALCLRLGPHEPEQFLLTGTEKFMEPRALQYRFSRYAGDCGLKGVHFHTLRHTFATRCVEAGFEIKSLSEILGHANTSITLNRYVHSSMDLKRENMNKLGDMGV